MCRNRANQKDKRTNVNKENTAYVHQMKYLFGILHYLFSELNEKFLMYHINYFKTQDDAINSTPNFPCIVKLATSDKVGFFNPQSEFDGDSFIVNDDFITLGSDNIITCEYHAFYTDLMTPLLFDDSSIPFDKMQIDGEISKIERNHTFETIGNHTVKFYTSNNRINNGQFYDNPCLFSITIPTIITYIGITAFWGCDNLKKFTYQGTKSQWANVRKDSNWNYNMGTITIHCNDGDVIT